MAETLERKRRDVRAVAAARKQLRDDHLILRQARNTSGDDRRRSS